MEDAKTLVGVVGHASGITGASGICITGSAGFAPINQGRIVDTIPSGIRWARKTDGSVVLQAAYRWREGWNEHGIEWRDVEVVDVSGGAT